MDAPIGVDDAGIEHQLDGPADLVVQAPAVDLHAADALDLGDGLFQVRGVFRAPLDLALDVLPIPLALAFDLGLDGRAHQGPVDFAGAAQPGRDEVPGDRLGLQH